MSPAKMPRQQYTWGETRLLMDYLAAAYAGRRWYTNIRVGPLDPHVPREGLSRAAQLLMGNFRRYADAVVVDQREVVVVETTMVKAVSKIGPLLEYLDLLPETPELVDVLGPPVRGELVSPIPDQRAGELCRRAGLKFVVFEPTWLDNYLQHVQARFRRSPLSEVEQSFGH